MNAPDRLPLITPLSYRSSVSAVMNVFTCQCSEVAPLASRASVGTVTRMAVWSSRSALEYADAAKRGLGLWACHERGLGRNNRAENSHQVVRSREWTMLGFKASGSAQRFLSVYCAVYNTFNLQRHLVPCHWLRLLRAGAAEQRQAATAAA